MENKVGTPKGTNHTVSTPLTNKIALTASRDKALEENGKIKTQTGFETANNDKAPSYSTRVQFSAIRF